MAHEAHVSRNFGRLKDGNRPGNPDNAPRCGARTKGGTALQGSCDA